METEKNKKSKFLLFPVKWLVALVLILLGGMGFLLFEALTPEYAERPRETNFVCGTCEELRSERALYTVNGQDGRALFKTNCSMCHRANDNRMAGVLDRIPGGNWKYFFVRNSDSLFLAGDTYTVAVREHYKTHCYNFPQLTNEQIDGLLLFMNQ